MSHDILLFDLDGTLTDPGEGVKNAAAYALQNIGDADKSRMIMIGDRDIKGATYIAVTVEDVLGFVL